MQAARLLLSLFSTLLFLFGLPGAALALDSVLVIPGTPGDSCSGSVTGPGASTGSSVLAFESLGGTDYLPGGQGVPTFHGTYRLVKVTDDATVPLVSNLMLGDLVPNLEIRAVVGSATIMYEFAGVIITAVNTAGSLDDPVDEVTFVPCAGRISSTSAGATSPAVWNFYESQPVYPGGCSP